MSVNTENKDAVVSAKSVGWTRKRFDKEYRGAVVTRDIGGIHHEVWFPLGISNPVHESSGSTGVWIRDSEFVE